MHANFLTCVWNFVIHVKNFCHLCERFSAFYYLWIFSHMWNNFFMHVNFKFHMHNRCYAREIFHKHVNTFRHVRVGMWIFFQGLLNATTTNHIFMKMPCMSSEYPMKDISWPIKTAKLSFMPLFLAKNFLWKGNFLFSHSWISYDQRFMGPEFSMKTCHRVFHGPWNHGTRLSRN